MMRRFFVLAMLASACAQPVQIKSVNPKTGSLAGGTRLHIKGAGFSNNMGGSQQVILGGKYFCDVIPLHSTVSQIACKTTSATDGSWQQQSWGDGWTDFLDVVVIVDGRVSECVTNDADGCKFQFRNMGWWDLRTPKVTGIEPKTVTTGSMITVTGRFDHAPFNFDEIKAPSQEVPLISVKVANRGTSFNRPKNEPFGSSGTRCGLFDPETEEPFGIVHHNDDENQRVYSFVCQVNGPREGGRYNLSVALLGRAMIPDSEMWMGESFVFERQVAVDHEGEVYMLQHVPTIQSIRPSATGLLGGARLTVEGDGFTVEKSAAVVVVSGVPCQIEFVSLTEIVCVLSAPLSGKAGFEKGSSQPGARGIHRRIWFGQASLWPDSNAMEPPTEVGFPEADLNDIVSEYFEAPINQKMDPLANFRGFFRPPVTSSYTILAACDDESALWLANQPYNTSTHNLEKLFRSPSYTTSRDFIRYFRSWAMEHGRNPAQRIVHEMARRSRKVQLEKGSAYYMDEWYKSGSGDENFALAAVLHTTNLNQKDKPSAIDEKQYISVEIDTQLAVYNISLRGASGGPATGSFKLRLGGKESDTIPADASRDYIVAALRELLSNCAVTLNNMPIERDSGGAVTDCRLGRGIEYRGLKSMTIDGHTCLAWDSVIDSGTNFLWDPWLTGSAGLTKNLCRNPDWRTSGPWCFYLHSNGNTYKQSCGIPQCGAGADDEAVNVEDREPFPMTLTFEGLFEADHSSVWGMYQGGFRMADGVNPFVQRGNAFCGQNTLHLPNSFGLLDDSTRWGRLEMRQLMSGDDKRWGWKTDEFPYMCMAYRIPSTSQVSMNVRIQGSALKEKWIKLNSDHDENADNVWVWAGIIADDTWRYSCFNFQVAIDQMAINGDTEFTVGDGYGVNLIRFSNDRVPRSSYGSNPFWIDEFSISPTERIVSQTQYPDVTAGPLQLVDVVRRNNSAEVAWEITISTDIDSCQNVKDGLVLDFAIDVESIENLESAEIKQVQMHSDPILGDLVLGFEGSQVRMSPYASAEELQEKLKDLPSLGDTKVTQTGVCQTGFGWMVQFLSRPGDQPLMEASMSLPQPDGRVRVAVHEMEAGGVLISPLPADYFQLITHMPSVAVSVNDAMADCRFDPDNVSLCLFEFCADLTPQHTATQSKVGNETGNYLVTFTGSLLVSPGEQHPVVHVEGFPCDVQSANASEVICKVLQPFLAAGSHNVSVIVPGNGRSQGTFEFVYALEITRVSPAIFDPSLPATITIYGAGFDPVASNNLISVGDTTCATTSVNASQLVCTLSVSSSRRRTSTSGISVVVGLEQVTDSDLVEFQDTIRPTIKSISQSAGSVGGGDPITITGTQFSLASELAVFLGQARCDVQNATATEITCTTQASAPGQVDVSVHNPEGGISEEAIAFEYLLSVSLVTPSRVALGGGVTVTATGSGLEAISGATASAAVGIAGMEVYNIGVYQASLVHEIHAVVLSGTYVDEIQRLDLTAAADSIKFRMDGVTSDLLFKSDNQYISQNKLNLMLLHGRVQVIRQEDILTVIFRGNVGNVALLEVLNCTDSEFCIPDTGAAVSEDTAGAAPSGHFRLQTGDINIWATSAEISINATGADVHEALAPLFPGGVSVMRTELQAGVSWALTYLSFQGSRDFPQVMQGSLTGGIIEMTRIQIGTSAVQGSFVILMDGKSTTELPVNASAQVVENVVVSTFPTVVGCDVVEAQNVPGRFLNRDYPRQWAIRMTRMGVAGLGVKRCTSPLFVDWDPSACPSTAADLFLNHYKWYWPADLPKPADLGEPAKQDLVQRTCDTEARTLNLKPGFCQVKVPAETLPLCGQGSGVNPPCWQTRFTVVNIQLNDGNQVYFERDDSNAPSDSQKGYRGWKQQDFELLRLSQQLSINASVTGLGAGVHVNRVYSKPEQLVQCAVTKITATSMEAVVPEVTDYLQSYTDLLRSDFLFKPSARLSKEADLVSAGAEMVKILIVPSLLASSDAEALSFTQASHIAIPFEQKHNEAHFALDLWVLLAQTLGANVPVVRSVGAGGAGYALVLTAQGRCQFWLGTGLSNGAVPHATFSVLDADCAAPQKRLIHIAVTFDGFEQKIFIDGASSNSKSVLRKFVPNTVAALYLGGQCSAADDAVCSGSVNTAPQGNSSSGDNSGKQTIDGNQTLDDSASPHPLAFEGVLDEILVYPAALSSGGVRGHARCSSQTLYASFRVAMSGFSGKCSGDCSMQLSASNTPSVFSISPDSGWSGMTVTITGQGFELQQETPVVNLGSRKCSIASRTSSSLVCSIQPPVDSADRLGPVEVSVTFATLGRSIESLKFHLTSTITLITPTTGSTLGGTLLTINTAGCPADIARIQVHVGPHICGVRSVEAATIICVLGMFRKNVAATFHVSITVDSVPSTCTSTSGCEWQASLDSTPTMQTVSTSPVSEGSILTINGSNLPVAVPVVQIGSIHCNVTSNTESFVVCNVGHGEGGSHHLTVLYLEGFAAHAIQDCCPRVSYTFTLASVYPSQGSRFGGQRVTLTGSAFTISGDAKVLIGGKECKILRRNSTSLVCSTPRMMDAPQIGAERHALAPLHLCSRYNTTATCDFSAFSLSTCKADLFPSAGTSPGNGDSANILMVGPGSDSSQVKDVFLIDSDPSTVWHSANGADVLKIAIDLGSARDIRGVSIQWAGQHSAQQVRVSLGDTCDAVAEILPWTGLESNFSGWDLTDEVVFALHQARIVLVELQGLQSGMQDLRIRDLVLVENSTYDEQPLLMFAGTEQASCASQQCHFAYSASPAISDIQPSSGPAGSQLTILGSGFTSDNCAANHVLIAGRTCASVSCDAQFITCVVPEQVAGSHSISVHIIGVGHASTPLTGLSFTQMLTVSVVEPSHVSFGGGVILTIKGSGFGTEEGLLKVNICNRACNVLSSNGSWLLCQQGPIFDVASVVGSNTRTVSVASGSDDAFEDENGAIVADSSVIGFELPQFMRFPSDEQYSDWARDYALYSNSAEAVRHAFLENLNREPTSAELDGYQGWLANGVHSIVSMREDISKHRNQEVKWYGAAWSRKTVYLRFTGLDIPQGAVVTDARLHIRAARDCPKGTMIRMWVEDADSSDTYEPAQRGSLGSRKRTKGLNWELQHAWKWMAEEHESMNLSLLLNAVVSRPGWNSKSNLTLVMQQAPPFKAGAVCQMLSTDYQSDYAPKLRLVLNPNSTEVVQATVDMSCAVSVTVPQPRDHGTAQMECHQPLLLSAKTTNAFSAWGKYTYQKKDSSVLTFPEAYELCASHGARLCTQTEIFDTPAYMGGMKPFFGLKSGDKYVPFNIPRDGFGADVVEAPAENVWVMVSEKQTVANKNSLIAVNPVWGANGTTERNNWVSCGTHVGGTCRDCPSRVGSAWCNGDCTWRDADDKCVRTSSWAHSDENRDKTDLIPCCGGPGHPAFMAVDGAYETYWLSVVSEEAVLEVEILGGAPLVGQVQIDWTDAYALEYSIEISADGVDYMTVSYVSDGDGGTDQITISTTEPLQHCPSPSQLNSSSVCGPNPHTCGCSKTCDEFVDCIGHGQCSGGACICDPDWAGSACNVKGSIQWRFLRILMHRRAVGHDQFGVKEVQVYGRGDATAACAMMLPVNASADGLLSALTSLTPKISAVEPIRGSTAGGTDVTVTGMFFTSDASLLNVTIGEFPCLVKSAETFNGQSIIKCVTGASGVLLGGQKHVIVTAKGHGASAPQDEAVFWYVDTWSARTTWGGSAPPTGCGSWVHDKDCTDSVVIPEGQVILLDVSLPRFYLILVEGTLIFDRADLVMGASYILLRGGTLQIGTELEPFMQQVKITMYGHPKSIELPTFGSKVIACYKCTMDIHGKPEQSWTELAETVLPGATEIKVMHAVAWPLGSKFVIATTDFESPSSSHSEVATVASISDGGKTIGLTDIRVCHTYSNTGLPLVCDRSNALKYPHLGEVKTFADRDIAFRAEVGLLSRNIVIEGDHDQTLCPLADLADDGVTRLSCNQFGAQMFWHSPGHESLIARVANFEIRNGGQAFRLGRYALHWHMVGNLRESYQRNVSVHHSWNRGTAVHGIHYLRLLGNFVYHIMGHTFFIEDGVEEYNVLDGNLAIKTIPSMNLLNTDQTPAGFWIVSGKNRIINNHAVASRRYGIWFRPEISATGTSVNTVMDVHPINIPVLEFDGNHAHSNGKYGLRIFDIFLPNAPSVFRNTFVWRNAKVGWTATVIGRVGFDGIVAVQNGDHVFESRSVSEVDGWDQAFIKNGFFVDYTGLPLAESFGEFSDNFATSKVMGGPMTGGILLPWNVDAGGGFSVHNTTFVNFKNGCIRGIFLCWRHRPAPPGRWEGHHGTGGSVCEGMIFRRSWYHIKQPSRWVGKALCVRMPWQSEINTCQSLQPECSCLPYLKKSWKGNVMLVAEGYRYNMVMDLLPHEVADPEEWQHMIWDVYDDEEYYFSQRLLQWDVADIFGRPLFWTENRGNELPLVPSNYVYNMSECSRVGCGQVKKISDYPYTGDDEKAVWFNGTGTAGKMDLPAPSGDYCDKNCHRNWAIQADADGNGALWTGVFRGYTNPTHRDYKHKIQVCPKAGCWPKAPPPPAPPPEQFFSMWSSATTWQNLTNHFANPLNDLETTEVGRNAFEYKLQSTQQWSEATPSAYDNVWIPSWKKILLDVDTPILGRVVVEGVLLINASSNVNLSAVWVEVKGGQLIIATVDTSGEKVLGPFSGSCHITLHGTNNKLAVEHGNDPRETPEVVLGTEGVPMGPATIGVFGKMIALGKPTSHSWSGLAITAAAGASTIVLDDVVDWTVGAEITITATDFDMHEAEVKRVVGVASDGSQTTLTLDPPLFHNHYAGDLETYGTREMRMQARVGLLSRNIVIQGAGQGEELPYHSWNAQKGILASDAIDGNGICENGENSLTSADCKGPAFEFGAAILVASYSEDFTYCDKENVCTAGVAREFGSKIFVQMDSVEMRYFGQNNIRPGIEVRNVVDTGPNCTISNMAMNRGYFYAIHITDSHGVHVHDNVFYRSHIPSLKVKGGEGNQIMRNLGVVGIFWNTHRGAIQGKGLANAKVNAMIGMFHDEGIGSILVGNVAAGSERAGFSGSGVACNDATSFTGNEAFSCLTGYHMDNTIIAQRHASCVAITDLRAWKIHLYGIYGEVPRLDMVHVDRVRIADAQAGTFIIMAGINALAHERKDQVVRITDSLYLGRSANQDCEITKPSLFTCQSYMAYCGHLGGGNHGSHVGIVPSQFISGPNMAPLIFPWSDAGAYDAIYGQTEIDGVTFAHFGASNCTAGPRQGHRDFAVSNKYLVGLQPDGMHPVVLSNIQKDGSADEESLVHFVLGRANWINQADCVDMDCDGPRNGMLRDDDGTFLGQVGSVLARAEKFNEGSFFGLPYKDETNMPDPETSPWWYPNLPAVMRTDKRGELIHVKDKWLSGGWGLHRPGCTLMSDWNAWKCLTTTSYRRLVIESMDPDHEIRRISPVAISSEEGYTHLLNGMQDHGWCFSYTCLKRLMTFAPTVAMGTEYTVHFSGTNPQKLRITLAHATAGEKMIVKIYYQNSQRLQVFVGNKFVEDINMEDGQMKKQLVRNGKWASNNNDGTYDKQLLDMTEPCQLKDSDGADRSASSSLCDTSPGNLHGANTLNRASGMLEIVVGQHAIDGFIDIITMPTVQISMTISASVESFYEIKDAFISSIASVLGIDVSRIAIVDVVPGNARRRRTLRTVVPLVGIGAHRQLLETGGASVDMEIMPSAEISILGGDVNEDAGIVNITVTRSVNIYPGISATLMSFVGNGSTATAGLHFGQISTVVRFAPGQSTAKVAVTILSVEGYSTLEPTFIVTLSNAQNASITSALAVITIRNVHSPQPGTPRLLGSVNSDSSFMIQWAAPVWPNSPSADWAHVLEYEVQKGSIASSSATVSSADWSTVASPQTNTHLTVTALEVYSIWKFRVRASTDKGWTVWSPVSSAIRSLAVCGDGKRHFSEECDSGATPANNGCDSITCQVAEGFSCNGGSPTAADTCISGCGDSFKTATEECDDGTFEGNDGCKSCNVEVGWDCSSNNDGGKTSDCATTCGDGKMAGLEQCDSGGLNTVSHGCNADCTKAANAVCTEDEESLSHCRLCGNGKREEGEMCDDNSASAGCSLDCSVVTLGWDCTGGSQSTADICIAGPTTPGAPVAGSKTETSISWIWSQVDGRGLPVLHFDFQYDIKNTSSVRHEVRVTMREVSLTLVRDASVAYAARVRACNSAGCSAYSTFGASVHVMPPAAAAQLADVVNTISEDPLALVAGTNLSISALAVEAPAPEVEAPIPDNTPALNATQIAALQASMGNGTVVFEGTPPPVVMPAPPGSGGLSFSSIEPAVGFSVHNATVVAGEILVLEVILSTFGDDTAYGGSLKPISMDWQAHAMTAKQGVDYQENTGSLVFTPGVTRAPLTITTLVSARTTMLRISLGSFVNAKPHSILSYIMLTIVAANVTVTSAAADIPTTPPPHATTAAVTTPLPNEVIVSVKVGLSMTLATFSQTLQLKFRTGISVVCGVNVTNVIITSIKAVSSRRRHLLADTLEVSVEISTSDTTTATTVASKLTTGNINTQITAQGLPSASVLEVPTLSTVPETCTTTVAECNSNAACSAKPSCTCIATMYTCSMGCHTKDLISTLNLKCDALSCNAACPLVSTMDPNFVEKVIDVTVDNTVALPSGEGVQIPAGALRNNAKIGVQVMAMPFKLPGHQMKEGLKLLSKALTFSPSGTVFLNEVTLKILFDGTGAASGKRLAIFRYNPQTMNWDEKKASVTFPTERAVRVKIMSFSTYAIFEAPVVAQIPADEEFPANTNYQRSGWLIAVIIVIVVLLIAGALGLKAIVDRGTALEYTKAKNMRDSMMFEPTVINTVVPPDSGSTCISASMEANAMQDTSRHLAMISQVQPIHIIDENQPALTLLFTSNPPWIASPPRVPPRTSLPSSEMLRYPALLEAPRLEEPIVYDTSTFYDTST